MNKGSWKREKRYIIKEISSDGLLKSPVKDDGYYGRSTTEDWMYATNKEAEDQIERYDWHVCVILKVYVRVWVPDEN